MSKDFISGLIYCFIVGILMSISENLKTVIIQGFLGLMLILNSYLSKNLTGK